MKMVILSSKELASETSWAGLKILLGPGNLTATA